MQGGSQGWLGQEPAARALTVTTTRGLRYNYLLTSSSPQPKTLHVVYLRLSQRGLVGFDANQLFNWLYNSSRGHFHTQGIFVLMLILSVQ